MELLNNLHESITSEQKDKITELEDEVKTLKESNHYYITDDLASNGFYSTYEALYRFYSVADNGNKYYLRINRTESKKFELNFTWCIQEDNNFNVVTDIFSQTKTIYENREKRNRLLGKYTNDFELPRSQDTVKEFLNTTWKLIIESKDCLNILKDKHTEFSNDKYSDTNILMEYCVLSDMVIDNGIEYWLLHVKDEKYTLFSHNTDTGKECQVNFKWQTLPSELLKADVTDSKIALFFEKLQQINPTGDACKIKDDLFKSILEVGKDTNKRLSLLNNASSSISIVLSDAIHTLRGKYFDTLNKTIKDRLNSHKSPTIQMLSDYLNASDEFYIAYDIKKRFRKTDKGFIEITIKDISNFFNNEFGYNKISLKQCNECMDYITRELTINYDVLQFKNGVYNTFTGKFRKGEYITDSIPKLNLTNYNYIPDAKEQFLNTDLYHENKAILTTEREGWRDWNEHVFYKSIGSSYYGVNVADKLFILHGKPDSRKSTLLTIIKRIFNGSYCNKKIHEVVKNERFVLVPVVNKAVLIDDDASDLQIKNIGNLNSFVSGTGLYIEFKNANEGVHLNEYNTPRIWCACNELFNVIGSGFKRRLCLILCDNVFDKDTSSKSYMEDILHGERDTELELMISYSLQLYESEKDKAFLTSEQEDLMFDEFEFKSYIERRFAKDVFIYADEMADFLEDTLHGDVGISNWSITYNDTGEVEKVNDTGDADSMANIPAIIPTFLSVKDANTVCRKYLKYQREHNRIFDSQTVPSSKKIKTALEMFGYNQTTKNYVFEGKRSSMRVYENIVVKPEWVERLGLELFMDRIVTDYL